MFSSMASFSFNIIMVDKIIRDFYMSWFELISVTKGTHGARSLLSPLSWLVTSLKLML